MSIDPDKILVAQIYTEGHHFIVALVDGVYYYGERANGQLIDLGDSGKVNLTPLSDLQAISKACEVFIRRLLLTEYPTVGDG